MDPTCLKIKFMPIFRSAIQNSSTCWLEIIPEVSHIQNLDNIEWKQEADFIEYTIPMTHKIILKKQKLLEEFPINEEIKTYHSCVDLLIPSYSNIELASRDISRLLSDTYIMGNFSSIMPNDGVQDLYVNESCQSNEVEIPKFNKSTEIIKKTGDIEINIGDATVEYNLEDHNCVSKSVVRKDVIMNKILSKANHGPVFSNAVHYVTSADQEYTRPKTNKTLSSLRQLSLSPLCSVNTQETVDKVMVSKEIVCKLTDCKKDLATRRIHEPHNNMKNFIHGLPKMFEMRDEKTFESRSRIPPEIRVAEFLQYMQREVLPLNNKFNEIRSKCSMLGIHFNIRSHKNLSTKPKVMSFKSLMYKPISNYGDELVQTGPVEPKSNRVVYTVVFND